VLKAVPYTGLDELLDDDLRFEDIRSSPSGRTLVVVATNGIICLFAADTSSRPVRITRHAELSSTSLASPHGVDFLSEDVIVVANRAAWLTFYRIPNVDAWQGRINVEPIHEMDSVWFGRKGATRNLEGRDVSCGPGSVRVYGKHLFVSCNNLNTVTAHPYRLQQQTIETGDGAVVAQSGLEIPDGISMSRDGRRMAVSNHNDHGVVVYRTTDKTQSCVLRDVDLRYPHGLCFDPTGRALYVADAGERHVHVFFNPDGEWDKPCDRSAFKLPAVGMEAFRKTKEAAGEEKYRALEGGIKGIDVDPSGRIVVTTCRHQTLRFFEAAVATVESAFAAE
jgi:hypothetical protein